jgi:hypothetical protein
VLSPLLTIIRNNGVVRGGGGGGSSGSRRATAALQQQRGTLQRQRRGHGRALGRVPAARHPARVVHRGLRRPGQRRV